MQLIVEWWYFELMMILCGLFSDPAQLAASVLIANFATIAHMFPMGVGIITTKLVGNAIGENQVKVGKSKSVTSMFYCLVIQAACAMFLWMF